MPGTYRSIRGILPTASPEKAKAEQQSLSESEEQEIELSRECQDGKWTLQQNLNFAVFVHYHEVIFASKRKRKLCKIFKSLSDYLQTRSPTQCRSHFQKMISKHKSVTRLKKYFKGLFGTQKYLEQMSDFKLKWEQDHQPLSLIYPQLKETKEASIQTDDVRPEATLCASCAIREEAPQALGPSSRPYEMNPLLYWWNTSYYPEVYSHNYMAWMSGVNPLGRSDS